MGSAAFAPQLPDLALHIATLLQSARAMYQAHDSASLRSVWERHLTALIGELILFEASAVLMEDYVSQQCVVPAELTARLGRQRNLVHSSAADLHSLLAPLLVRSELAGAIYLQRRSAAFTEAESALLTAVAQLASFALEGAYQEEWLEEEVKRLEHDLHPERELIGESQKIRELCDKIVRIAPSNATVLITGESGTGKELVARSLHRNSPRATRPFIAINCAALSETLLESELFGHERGAFTGALLQKRGRLECGEGGTVFLDEIGEMPLSLQVKLLRVLQAREFERVGGTRTIPLDIRVIAATNRNLEECIRRGQFREDLYYRLNVMSLRTPPLRDRPEDILPLATQFAARFSARSGRRVTGISPEARTLLRRYPWPGNVRQLENAIEHAVVLGANELIRVADLPESLQETRPAAVPNSPLLQDAVNSAKKLAVERAFEQAHNDHNAAARLLGVHPNYLYRLIRNLELQGLLKFAADEQN